MTYEDFLEGKVAIAKQSGFDVETLNAALFPHQADSVRWDLKGGRRAIFASFGNGKTNMGLELAHRCAAHTGKQSLIICPLGVKQEFEHDAREILGYNSPRYVKTQAEVEAAAWNEDVWDDIARMRTLNTEQSRRRQQMHVCPFQLDTVERLINRYSNKGDKVLDFFGGIMTVPYTAVKMGRYGIGIELNSDYFRDGVAYCKQADLEKATPTLFDFLEEGA